MTGLGHASPSRAEGGASFAERAVRNRSCPVIVNESLSTEPGLSLAPKALRRPDGLGHRCSQGYLSGLTEMAELWP